MYNACLQVKAFLHFLALEDFAAYLCVLLNYIFRCWAKENIEIKDTSTGAKCQRWLWTQSDIWKKANCIWLDIRIKHTSASIIPQLVIDKLAIHTSSYTEPLQSKCTKWA